MDFLQAFTCRVEYAHIQRDLTAILYKKAWLGIEKACLLVQHDKMKEEELKEKREIEETLYVHAFIITFPLPNYHWKTLYMMMKLKIERNDW